MPRRQSLITEEIPNEVSAHYNQTASPDSDAHMERMCLQQSLEFNLHREVRNDFY